MPATCQGRSPMIGGRPRFNLASDGPGNTPAGVMFLASRLDPILVRLRDGPEVPYWDALLSAPPPELLALGKSTAKAASSSRLVFGRFDLASRGPSFDRSTLFFGASLAVEFRPRVDDVAVSDGACPPPREVDCGQPPNRCRSPQILQRGKSIFSVSVGASIAPLICLCPQIWSWPLDPAPISIRDPPAIDHPDKLLDAAFCQVVVMRIPNDLDQGPEFIPLINSVTVATHAAATEQLKAPRPWFLPPPLHSQFMTRPVALMHRALHSWHDGNDLNVTERVSGSGSRDPAA